MLSFRLRVLDSASILTQCVFLCGCVSFYKCVCWEEGKASDKWLSFGPGELFTSTCFIFSAQEGKCVYVCVRACKCVYVEERTRERERTKSKDKKQIANLELHPDRSKMTEAEDGDLKCIGVQIYCIGI